MKRSHTYIQHTHTLPPVSLRTNAIKVKASWYVLNSSTVYLRSTKPTTMTMTTPMMTMMTSAATPTSPPVLRPPICASAWLPAGPGVELCGRVTAVVVGAAVGGGAAK